VEVTNQVPQAGQIDLLRPQQRPQPRFDCEYDAHQAFPLAVQEIGHLGNVGVPDHAAIAGISRLRHTDDPALLIAPDEFPAVALA